MSAYFPVLDGGLAKYLRDIRAFPVLEPEEEYMLAQRWVQHGDTGAAHRLVTSHLRLVAKIAMRYRHYGLPLAELIGEGNIGLMRAVKKFDPEKGFRLATYAIWWIKASLNEFVLGSWSLVKIGTLAAQKKLFFNLRRVKAKLDMIDHGDLSPGQVRQIALELDVPDRDVVAMDRRLSARDSSLNVPVGDSQLEMQDLVPDESDNQETVFARAEELGKGRALIHQAMEVLSERERAVFAARRLSDAPPTLDELGVRFGVSRERIRQIEAKAFEKVQAVVRAGFLPALPVS